MLWWATMASCNQLSTWLLHNFASKWAIAKKSAYFATKTDV